MLMLTMRTDRPLAELCLFDKSKKIETIKWKAHRQLAATIHLKIQQLLQAQNKNLSDLSGVVCFKGPGSFTGLRIGVTIANTFAYGLGVPIVGAKGPKWKASGLAALQKGKNDKIITPYYGRQPNIGKPKK